MFDPFLYQLLKTRSIPMSCDNSIRMGRRYLRSSFPLIVLMYPLRKEIVENYNASNGHHHHRITITIIKQKKAKVLRVTET